MIHVVLYQPEIPANTGNIGRVCVAVGARLHLIGPLGFYLTDRHLRRAGMDYWERLDVRRYTGYEDFLEQNPDAALRLFPVETMAPRDYTSVSYGEDCYLMLGRESTGIPEEILLEHEARCVRIPMLPGTRSMNLSDCASIVIFEALRQAGFPGLEKTGALRHGAWTQPG